MAAKSHPLPLIAPADKPQSSRDVILAVAESAFYANGIHRTTTEEILERAKVSRRAYAKHFGSKELLVVAYLDSRHQRDVDLFETLVRTGLSHQLTLNVVLSEIVAELNDPDFRGCAFINAAIESRDSKAVQDAVRRHREWYIGAATEVLRNAGHRFPADAADDLLLARDGAMTSTYAGDTVSATASLRRTVDRVLAEVSEATDTSGS